jgi:hypothetical protein
VAVRSELQSHEAIPYTTSEGRQVLVRVCMRCIDIEEWQRSVRRPEQLAEAAQVRVRIEQRYKVG